MSSESGEQAEWARYEAELDEIVAAIAAIDPERARGFLPGLFYVNSTAYDVRWLLTAAVLRLSKATPSDR